MFNINISGVYVDCKPEYNLYDVQLHPSPHTRRTFLLQEPYCSTRHSLTLTRGLYPPPLHPASLL